MKRIARTEVSLFAGVGGMMLGFKRAGWRTLAAAETDKRCQQVLAEKFPEAHRLGDVRYLSGGRKMRRWMRSHFGSATLLTYTFPCQDLSVAGKREGLAGARSGLFYDAIRIRNVLACPLSLAENVPGLLTSDQGRDFARCLSALVGGSVAIPTGGWSSSGVAAGHRGVTAWSLLDVQHFGPPQRRVRLFMLTAHAIGNTGTILIDPAEVLSLTARMRRDSEASGGARKSSASPAGGGAAGAGAGGSLAFNWQNGGGYGDANPGLGITEEGTGPLSASQVMAVVPFDTTQITHPENRSNPQPGAPIHPLSATAHPPLIVMAHGQANAEIRENACPTLTLLHEAPIVAGTLRASSALDENGAIVAGTLRASDGGVTEIDASANHVIPAPGAPRRLTPLECTRLMGWDDDHLTITPPLADTVKYRMCGNGVGAPVAEWIAWRLDQLLP